MVGATARRPDGWDSFEMGAGIVDARALLEADLDVDRGRESVSAPADPRVAAALTVASLAAEEIGPAEALRDPPDWYAHGPELSWLLLQRARDRRGGGLVEEEAADRPVPSDDLDGAVGNPALRDALGLGGPTRRSSSVEPAGGGQAGVA